MAPTNTEGPQDGGPFLLDDVSEECDRLAAILVVFDDPDEDRERLDQLARRLQALSFFRLAIAVENLGAEATDELMQATVDEVQRHTTSEPGTFGHEARRASSRLPKRHAGG